MGHWDDIRRGARARRDEILAAAGRCQGECGLLSAHDLLKLIEVATDIPLIGLREGDALLYGAQAWLGGDPQDRIIYYNRDAESWRIAFYQAHEFAHLWLHHTHGAAGCGDDDLDPDASEATLPIGIERVQGYGPRERREREANVFAREFLLPSDALRQAYVEEGLGLPALSSLVGLPPSLVAQQLSYALLTPTLDVADAREDASENTPDATVLTLDESQDRAARVERGPILVEAGPGTGKTRTLVARILHLLESGVAPTAILALTFSNKAAEEMRSRVAAVAPEDAPLIWMGTFHAFGLELLRKYGSRASLPAKFGLIDPVDAVLALEHALPDIQLDHYMNLYEPTTHLRDILGAISRAKDEFVGPQHYLELAQGMLERAANAEETLRAEKALEVARVYSFYQDHLREEGLVDFGDLIFRAISLLRDCPEVRGQLRRAYSHVLVDEYQDVNRASGLLLKELAGSGHGLWTVGDARQAIYRFRGAAPINMTLFTTDFPGATVLPLEVNYRSQPPIVSLFSELAPRMSAAGGVPFAPWASHRSHSGGRVLMEIADNEAAEADGIARVIEAERADGVPYREQVVLCRTHTNLARIGAALEERGVPVLYLGDLFEREEVRDLLALLSLACGDERGLVRVARFPEYSIPLRDVRTLLKVARDEGHDFPDALELASERDDISDSGKAGSALLAAHLEESTNSAKSAWSILSRYLFCESRYVQPLLADESVRGQQCRLAIFQLLQFALEQRHRPAPDGSDPRRYLLDYIRRLETFGEERELRQVPDWAQGIDAVRLLTVHASKGLEFAAVYIPKLGAGHFPSSRKPSHCPPPAGLLADGEADWHEEEEECLFFVAVSRARDLLCLSRAKRYGARNSNPSRLLGLIAAGLPGDANGPVTWQGVERGGVGEEASAPSLGAAPPVKSSYTLQMLEVYMKCPRQFFYDYMLELGGSESDAAYVRFHRCVYRALDWIREEQAAGREVEDADALAHLIDVWAEEGPRGHVHEAIYREQAEAMLARALSPELGLGLAGARPRWEVPLSNGRVAFWPDRVAVAADGTSVQLQRLRMGRPSKSEKADEVYGLYHAAGARLYPGAKLQVQTVYLSNGQVDDIDLNERQVKDRLDKFDAALYGIACGNFAPSPSDRHCPRCRYYFVCPKAEDA